MGNEPKLSQKNLFDKGVKEFESGNYRSAGKTLKEIVDSKPNQDIMEKTQDMLKKLSYDPLEILLGAFAFTLLTILYIYFGFIK